MPKFSKKIFEYSFYVLFMLAFLFVAFKLFIGGSLFENIENKLFFHGSSEVTQIIKDLRIIYPEEALTLEPTTLNPSARQRLLNIYEPLVKPDHDLKIRPALALSWGLIDDYTWEFKLRPNVVFHDGSKFDANDAAYSVERARSYPNSELAGFFETVDEVKVLDDLDFRIVTKEPDPLILQKLSMVLVVSSEFGNENLENPVGTGSNRFVSWEKGSKMVLEKFPDYWGKKAKFNTVEIFTVADKNERIKMYVDGGADVLAFVPYDAVSFLQEKKYQIATVPNLEVQFLIFNMKSPLMADLINRRIVSLVVDQNALVEAVGGYAKPVREFVSDGVFGSNPKIVEHEYDIEKAEELAEENLKEKTLQIHLPVGLDVLGEHLRTQLDKIGVKAIVSYLEMSDLIKSMQAKKADIYFLGLKADLGDSASFLKDIVYSKGAFNIGGYSSPEVDTLIDSSSYEMDERSRLSDLQKAMSIVTEKDVIGVPLFEYENVYSLVDSLELHPRIDGFIYFDELKTK